MKRWLEDISVEMGYGGGINEAVMAEGQRRLVGPPAAGLPQEPPQRTPAEEEARLRGLRDEQLRSISSRYHIVSEMK